MKRTHLLAVLMLFLAGRLCAEDLAWQDDYDKTLATAKEKHQPVMLDFSASWCGPCRMMKTTTFADGDVRAALGDYLLVKIDLDQNAALAGKYGVQAIPACILLNEFGEKVSEHVGYVNAAAFNEWLTANQNDAFAHTSKKMAIINHISAFNVALFGTDPAARDRAMDSLLKIYCARDANDAGVGAAYVKDELRVYVQQHPAGALVLLNDPRLAVRILFATLLTEKLGPTFQFDAWEKSDERAAEVAVWTKKLEAR